MRVLELEKEGVMTPEEKNRLIAEKVMGWYIDDTSYRSIQYGIVTQAVYFDTDGPKQLIDEYDPYHNIEQAMEALQVLVKRHSRFPAMLHIGKDKVGCVCGTVAITHDTPSAAIVDTIVEVVGRSE